MVIRCTVLGAVFLVSLHCFIRGSGSDELMGQLSLVGGIDDLDAECKPVTNEAKWITWS